jgi:hypothetical protein
MASVLSLRLMTVTRAINPTKLKPIAYRFIFSLFYQPELCSKKRLKPAHSRAIRRPATGR